jgi:hypothetical protein
VNADQENLVKSTLKSVLDAALMSSIWQLPLWTRIAIGAIAFALLYAIAR